MPPPSCQYPVAPTKDTRGEVGSSQVGRRCNSILVFAGDLQVEVARDQAVIALEDDDELGGGERAIGVGLHYRPIVDRVVGENRRCRWSRALRSSRRRRSPGRCLRGLVSMSSRLIRSPLATPAPSKSAMTSAVASDPLSVVALKSNHVISGPPDQEVHVGHRRSTYRRRHCRTAGRCPPAASGSSLNSRKPCRSRSRSRARCWRSRNRSHRRSSSCRSAKGCRRSEPSGTF